MDSDPFVAARLRMTSGACASQDDSLSRRNGVQHSLELTRAVGRLLREAR